jgi:hypothetical protein
MKTNPRWILLLSLAGGATPAAVEAVRVQYGRRQEDGRQQKVQLQTWEGEGGNISRSAVLSNAPWLG